MPQSRASRAAESTLGRDRALNDGRARSPVLRAVDAVFAREGEVLVEPFSIELHAGQRTTLHCSDARAAKIAARMVAGIVKATRGTLLVNDFDPRIQPVQAKRVVGYVPWNGAFGWLPGIGDNRQRAVELHAKLFDVPHDVAQRRVAARLSEIGAEDDVSFAAALALIRPVLLLVLDRPPYALEERLAKLLAGSVALLSTGVRVELPRPGVLSAR